jgi:hypothetical protein
MSVPLVVVYGRPEVPYPEVEEEEEGDDVIQYFSGIMQELPNVIIKSVSLLCLYGSCRVQISARRPAILRFFRFFVVSSVFPTMPGIVRVC